MGSRVSVGADGSALSVSMGVCLLTPMTTSAVMQHVESLGGRFSVGARSSESPCYYLATLASIQKIASAFFGMSRRRGFDLRHFSMFHFIVNITV